MTGVDHPTIPYPAPPPPPSSGGRPGRTVWIAVGVAAVVLLIGGGALLAYVLVGSDRQPSVTATDVDTTEVATSRLEGPAGDAAVTTAPATEAAPTLAPATAPPTTAPPTAPPATAPPATAPPATPPPAAPRAAVPARVSRTCGADGTGDCFVSLRAGPTSSGSELGRLNEGNTITLECQQRGESVRSSALGYSTDVWARSTDGRWLAMAFLDAPGWSLSDVTVPC